MSIYAKEFEQFIISGFREETLNSLVPGGQAARFLDIVRKINEVEKVFSEEVCLDKYF